MYDYLSLHNLLFSLELIIVSFHSFPSFFDWFLMNLPQIYPKLLNTFEHISICFLLMFYHLKKSFPRAFLPVLFWIVNLWASCPYLGVSPSFFPQGFIWSSLLGWIPEVINPVLSFLFLFTPLFCYSAFSAVLWERVHGR